MKQVIFCLLLFCSISLMAQQVVINGNFHSTQKEFKVEDISEFQYLRPPNEKLTVRTDTGGNFSIRFDITKAGYYRIGRNILFLSPGDKLKVLINHLNPNLSSFEGVGSEANTYLKDTPFPKGGSYLESGKNINPNPKTQLESMLNKASERRRELNKLKGVSLAFKSLELARIKADVINSINSLRYYAPRKLTLDADSASKYIDAFNQLAKVTVNVYLPELRKPEYLQLVVVRDIARLMLANVAKHQKSDAAFVLKVKDWIKADSLVQLMTGMEDKLKIAAFSSQLYSIKSPEYRQAAFKMRSSLMQYGNGDSAIDFLATDLAAKQVRLSDFKGKIIFIDLWATWCGPCLQEMPAFEKLKERYSGNNNVVFISLSIDDDLDGWKKNVALRKAEGIQWHINRSGLKDYRIVNIPRTIIIDQQFKIANFQAPAPSSNDNVMVLDRLINQSKGDNTFSIDGKLTEFEKSSVLFLSYMGKDNQTVRDSVRLTSGHFHFEGAVRETEMANLLLSHTGYYVVKKNSDQNEIIIGSHRLTINGTDSIATAHTMGDDENLAYDEFKNEFNPLVKSQRSMLSLLTPENRANNSFMEGLKQKNQDLVIKQKSLQKSFIIKYPNLMASLSVLKSYAGALLNVKEIEPLYNSLSADVKQSIQGRAFAQTLKHLSEVAVGQMAPDFRSIDESGTILSLSDFKGKYVLLDFWASWCAPCRAENPNILLQYNQYKSHGFEVLGVSLDVANAKDAWLKAIRNDGLIWKNVSELNGFSSTPSKLYHIDAIPQNFLIDPSGKIIASNLRGAELSQKLKDIFGGK